MMLEAALRLTGISLIALSLAHIPYAKRFGWKEDFAKVSLLNRQIFYVHCVFLCLILIMMGLLCLVWPGALLQPSSLGLLVSGGLCFFWFCRLLTQWFIYDAALWRGKPFETFVHFAFTCLWTTYTGLFGFVWWGQWTAR
jgi:hypothetical protein